MFERHLWADFSARGMPVDEIPALSTDVAQLAELATSVVTTELHERFSAFAAHYIDAATRGASAAEGQSTAPAID